MLRGERLARAEAGHWKVFKLPPQPDNHDFLVRNAESNSSYRVALEPSADLASCTCEDYKNTCLKFGILCKHIEAVKISNRGDGQHSPVPLLGKAVSKGGRCLVSLGPGNGRLVNYHSRHGCGCFMKSFCYRTSQKCFQSSLLDRWIDAGLVPAETPLDAPIIRNRVAKPPSDRPWGEWEVYEGALNQAWSVLPVGSKPYLVDNGGKEVPHQVVLFEGDGACSCGEFYQTGRCSHVDMAREALRRGRVFKSRRKT